MRNRILLPGLLALGVSFLLAAKPAQAQIGFVAGFPTSPGGRCHYHHGHSYSLPYTGYRSGYGVYGPRHYGNPGLTVTRSRYYAAPVYRPVVVPSSAYYRQRYGLTPYVPAATLPRVQLRLGF